MGFLSKTYDRYRTGTPRLETLSNFYTDMTPFTQVQEIINRHIHDIYPQFPEITTCTVTPVGHMVVCSFFDFEVKLAFKEPRFCTTCNILDFIIKELEHHMRFSMFAYDLYHRLKHTVETLNNMM